MKIIVLASVVALAGCVSTTEVVELGRDSYMVGTSARGGGQTRTEVMQISIKRANEFCAAKGLVMVVDHVESSGITGLTSRESQLTFLCVDKNDPANARVHLRKDADSVVQFQK